MNKKIMKRSLVLGALMAFVITGSAMAAEVLSSDANVNVNGKYVGDFTLGSDVVELKTDGKYLVLGTTDYSQQTTVEVKTGQILRLVGNYSEAQYNQGVLQNTTITGNGKIELIRNGLYGAIGHYDGNATNKVDITADTIIAKAPKDVIYLNNGGKEIVSLKAREIYLESNWPVYACGQAELEIKASEKLMINGLNGGAIIANDGSNIVIGSLDANQKADIVIVGNVVSLDASNSIAGAGNVNIELETAKSSITGVFESWSEDKDTEVRNLTLSNGATWNVTGDSTVTNLTGTEGIVKLGMVYDEDIQKDRIATVTVKKTNQITSVTGNGDVADAIAAKTVDTGDLANALNGGVGITSINTDEGVVAGAMSAVVENGTVGTVKEAVNTVNKSIGEAAVVGIAHFRAHMNDMNKRMGELRMANGESGVWTRMVRGEEEFAGAKSQYNQYQLGYDEKLSVDKRWTVGAAVTFAEGNGNFANGSTENDSTAFAIYGSKLNNDGSFVDLIARYANFDSDITMAGEKADYSTNGYSVSAEFGKRIQQGNGLWIEPQIELTYGSVDSAEYTISGRNVQVGDMDSLIGRVGFSLGKDIKQGNVYARASYLYDFDGETETTFGNGNVTRTIKEDLGGGWWEVGVGANINLSKATYIYADVEKTFGGEVDTNWKWNLGVRYSF